MTVAVPIQAPTTFAAPTVLPGPAPVENRIVLDGVSWDQYEQILDAMGERRIRLTYDRGTLEIMTVSSPHEWWKFRFCLALQLLGTGLAMKVQTYGSMTNRREDVERGLEPDLCVYVRNADRMVGPRMIDLNRDPAPDLAIEIDISRSSLNRLGIYAALNIPEVWRFDETTLHVYGLRPDATYEGRAQSLSFPALPMPEFLAFLQQTQTLNDSEFIPACLEWVRQNVLPRLQNPPAGS